MSVTIIDTDRKAQRVSGTDTVIGKAYRLVKTHHDQASPNIGAVYMRIYNGCVNLKSAGVRSIDAGDKYEEVDLEIHVKEKN